MFNLDVRQTGMRMSLETRTLLAPFIVIRLLRGWFSRRMLVSKSLCVYGLTIIWVWKTSLAARHIFISTAVNCYDIIWTSFWARKTTPNRLFNFIEWRMNLCFNNVRYVACTSTNFVDESWYIIIKYTKVCNKMLP